MIRVGNAPCSWGVLEFDLHTNPAPSPSQMLDEMEATGFAGTELGDWGFLPTDPVALRRSLDERSLALVGAFVPLRLADASAIDHGIAHAVCIATLLAKAGDSGAILVLADDNATVPNRTAHAGRIGPGDGLPEREWDGFALRAERVARAVRDAAGIRTAFHHHCAGYVETPQELDALMTRTDPTLLGVCLDTGHATFGGGDPSAMLRTYGARVWHVHVKDCDARVARQARDEGWDYHRALGAGLFCELGLGGVDFAAFFAELRRVEYAGWAIVEQDVLPGSGTPAASAARNRAFLQSLGL